MIDNHDSNREAVRRRLRKRLTRKIDEMEQLVRDIRYWNNARLDAPPFDCGDVLVAIGLVKQMVLHLDSDEPFPNDLWQRFVTHTASWKDG